MPVETATYIDELVVTNPPATDTVAQGDDHIRLIKAILKATFPGLTEPRYIEQARANLVSASAPDLWAVTSNYVNITGTTTITDFADADVTGKIKIVRFDDILTLTHNAAAIDLPTGANIVTAAGDHAIFVSQGTTLHRCIAYFRKDGKALAETPEAAATTDDAGVIEISTVAEVRSAATGDKALTAELVEGASAQVGLSDGATVAVDWDTFITATLTLGGDRTLGNPTNMQNGTYRTLEVKGDGSFRDLAFGSNYRGETETILDIGTGLGQRALIGLYKETNSGSGHCVVTGVTRY